MISKEKRAIRLAPINIANMVKAKLQLFRGHIETKVTKEYIMPILPREYPTFLNYGFLRELFSSHDRVDVGIHVERIRDEVALNMLQRELATVEAEINTTDSASFKYSKLMLEYNSAKELRDLISARRTHLYKLVFTIVVKGKNYKEAKERLADITARLKAMNFMLSMGYYRAWEIYRSTLPIMQKEIPYNKERIVHTDVLTAFFPFISEHTGVIGENMILYGINDLNATPVFVDRFQLASYNMLVFGKTGSGKSYFEKLSILRTFNVNPRIIIYGVDPLSENAGVFRQIGGVNVKLWQGKRVINPLDRLGEKEATKIREVISMLEGLFDITSEERALLDVILAKLYREKEEPIMEDLIRECEKEPKLERLTSLLRIFEDGTLKFLNQPTNLELTSERVNFDLGGTPEDQLGFFMSIVLSYIYSHIRFKKYKEREKLIYIDEVHHLWTHEGMAETLNWMARHTRHYKAGMTLLTQSANDAFLNKHTRAIMENTELHLLFYHDYLTQEVRDFYKFIPQEVQYITTRHKPKETGYSIGLLRLGPVKVPIRIYASVEEDRAISEE